MASGRVFVGAGGGRLLALEVATGRAVWSLDTSGPAHASPPRGRPTSGRVLDTSPVVVDGTVFAAGVDGSVLAVDAASGALRWKRKIGCESSSSVAVAGGTVFAGALLGDVHALDARTGEPRWERRTRIMFHYCLPVVAGGTALGPRLASAPSGWPNHSTSVRRLGHGPSRAVTSEGPARVARRPSSSCSVSGMCCSPAVCLDTKQNMYARERSP